LVVGVLLALPASGQVRSPIADYLQPYGGLVNGTNIVMTPDGEWIFFNESWGSGCSSGAFERISRIRPDGTGYRVILDKDQLALLKPTPVASLIRDLRVSGDGRWLAFAYPAKISVTCVDLPPVHWYLANVQSGTAKAFKWGGKHIGWVSFTDDGSLMAFKGYDPATDSWWFHVGEPQGTTLANVTKFLDTGPWLTTPGIISPDGSKFLFSGTLGGFPFPSDVYLYDFATQQTTKLNPEPVGNVDGLSLSGDGQRLVYAGAGPVYAMNADGTDFHSLPGVATYGSATLTRDGEHVFWADWTNGPANTRSTWDGRDLLVIKGWTDATAVTPAAVNADGSMMAVIGQEWTYWPLTTWFESGPVLTTYGHGKPGSTITWDIGGEAGDSYLLMWSIAPASLRLPAYGLLGLEPSRLGVIASGAIAGPDNVGSQQLVLPVGLSVPSPVELYFQALVLDADRATGALSNRTTFIVHDGSGSLSFTGGGDEAGPWAHVQPAASASVPVSPSTPEERMWRMILADPSLWDHSDEP
jgi:hypothetical protein